MKNKFIFFMILQITLVFFSCESEQSRAEREARLEKERQEQELYYQYINNSLSNGATPYA